MPRKAKNFLLSRARAEPLANHRQEHLADAGKTTCTVLFMVVAMSAGKTPPPKRRGQSIPWDQSPLRRDQISVKLSSPSPFTSEA